MRTIFVAAIIGLLVLAAPIGPAFAGDREDTVVASCGLSGGDPLSYVGCVAAGFTGNEIDTCIKTPKKCFGPNNEIRKFFCAIGIGGGCHEDDDSAHLLGTMPFRGGCEAIFETGIYWSPDCTHLSGGGRTVNAWRVNGARWSQVRAMVVFKGCIYTAFNSGIYRSCDGIYLGGGRAEDRLNRKLYDGSPVGAMTVFNGALLTAFGGTIYRSVDGEHPAGGVNAPAVYSAGDVVRSMTVELDRGRYVLRTVFANNGAYCDPNGLSPGGGLPGVYHC